MSGGGRKNILGGQKKYLGGTDKFYLLRKRRPPKKKDLHPGRLSSFGAHALLGGTRSLPGGAQRNIMVRISLLAHKFRGEDQKKRSSARNLGSVLKFTRVFCSGTIFSHASGAQAVFWWAQAPRCTPVVPILLLSFGAQSSLEETHF